MLFALTEFVSAQTDSAVVPLKDTLPQADIPAIVRHNPLTIVKKDSLQGVQAKDSVSRKPLYLANWELNPSIPLSIQLLQHHPYFGLGSRPVIIYSGLKEFKGKEILFYGLIGLLLAFAFLRQAFPKYFN